MQDAKRILSKIRRLELKTRGLVEQALERVLGEPLSVTTVVRDEFVAPAARQNSGSPRSTAPARRPVAGPPVDAVAADPTELNAPVPALEPESSEDALVRLAQTLFDAEEIEPDDPVRGN